MRDKLETNLQLNKEYRIQMEPWRILILQSDRLHGSSLEAKELNPKSQTNQT